MPTVYTQSQDEFQINAIDIVHINPSILEGVNQVSGILPPHSAVPIVRFAPFYVVNPGISGEPDIPSILTCNPGVVSASPSTSFTYQWQLDGVDIIGQTSPTLLTDGTMDGMGVTCYVEAVNFLGMVSAISNEIVVSIVEPIRVEEQYFAVITGMEQSDQQTNMLFRGMAVSGMSLDAYNTTMNHMSYVVSGVETLDHMTTTHHENYTTTMFEYLDTLTMVNPGAELGDVSGWTVTEGTLTVGTADVGSGTYYFQTSTLGDTKFYQDVSIPSEHLTDVDGGIVQVSIGFIAAIVDNTPQYLDDGVNCYVQCLDETGTLISTLTFRGVISPKRRIAQWVVISSFCEPIPALTRTLRYHVEYTSTFGANGCHSDDHSIQLWTAA